MDIAADSDEAVSVEGVAKSFGSARVIEDLDFSVGRGELVSLLGPSGCGKTTLLKLICGLIPPDGGRILVNGRDVTRVPAHKRNVSVVFQNYALFPHLNVADNVAFGLKARGTPAGDTPGRVAEALRLVRMSEFAERSVARLSGGQQQRVAVARALVVDPDLILLDEPFSALDRKLRETMQVELKALLRANGITAIFVTHDQEEAQAVSSRIAVMNAGRIEQYADPMTLYAHPASAFVLDFVGLSTRLEGRVTSAAGGEIAVDTALGPVTCPGTAPPGARVLVGVRPERISVGTERTDACAVTAEVADVMPLGSKMHIHGATTGDDRLLAERNVGEVPVGEGQAAVFSWPKDATLVYPLPEDAA